MKRKQVRPITHGAKRAVFIQVGLILAIFVSGAFAQQDVRTGYHVSAKITIGGNSGWDYLTFDNETRRLFITRKDPGVTVVAVDTQKITGIIAKTEGASGVACVPEFNRGFTSNSTRNTVTIFDLTTLQPIAEVAVGAGPDCITYDSYTKRIFVMNGRDGNATAIDAASGQVAGTIELDCKKPEFAVCDNQGRLYVNLQDRNEIAAIDTRDLQVKLHWSVGHGEKPTALAIDRERGLLLIGCRNSTLVIMAAKNGQIIAELPIGAGVDAVAYDPAVELIFTANSVGTMTVIYASETGPFYVAQTVPTQPGARTLALDQKTHSIYTVTAAVDRPGEPGKRPTFAPDSFVLLKVSR